MNNSIIKEDEIKLSETDYIDLMLISEKKYFVIFAIEWTRNQNGSSGRGEDF